MNIAIFCSASSKIESVCFERARELGEWMASAGHTMVFGGSDQGLMREIFDALHQAGGKCIGVIPEKLEKGGRQIPDMDVVIHTADVAERKEIMLEKAESVIILPGGIGTIDELFTTLTDNTLGYRSLKVIIYNIYGYWDTLLELFRDLDKRGALHRPLEKLFTVVTDINSLKSALS